MAQTLEHRILWVLKTASFKIAAIGSDTKGYYPINKTDLLTAYLHYGTLVATLNKPDFILKKKELFKWKIITQREEVEQIMKKAKPKVDWDEVSNSIETLSSNGHIEDKTVGAGIGITERTIKLTEQGLMALNTKYYEQQRQIRISQTATKYLAFATFLIAVVTVIVSLLQYIKPNVTSVPQLDSLSRQFQQYRTQSIKLQTEHNQLHPVRQDSSTDKK